MNLWFTTNVMFMFVLVGAAVVAASVATERAGRTPRRYPLLQQAEIEDLSSAA
jgi:hypothetical protein